MQDGQKCFGEMVGKYGVQDETKKFLDYIFSDEWTNSAEIDTEDDFQKNFSNAIDPLTQKIIGVPGDILVEQMPI